MSIRKSVPASTETPISPEPSIGSETTALAEDAGTFSTLEVHHGRFIEQDGSAAPCVRPTTDSEKMTSYDHNALKQVVVTETALPEVSVSSSPEPQQLNQPTILGLRRRTFFIVLAAMLVVVLVAAVGGGVGGAAAMRSKNKKAQTSSVSNITATNTTSKQLYGNTGLAVMQWTDPNSTTLYKKLYYQDKDNKIRESAWDNSTDFKAAWTVNTISDAVKPSTPIAAVAGWPHTSYNYSLVRNVYYMSPNDELVERQAKANDSQAWEDDNFTGLYSASNTTYLASYWCQNILNKSQELVVLFQRDNFEDGITQGRYTSANDSSNPWVANNFPFAQPKGAAFAMSLISYRSGKHLMLYTVGDDNKLGQYEYTINDNVDSTSLVSITSQSTTPLTVDPQAPLAVVAQDNQPLYASGTLPECYQQTPLTNLIFFASEDRKSLTMSAWNCTAGFEDHTAEIEPLQKKNTTYLALAAMSDRVSGDGNVYIMFDSGNGPQVEEWTVPKRAGEPWNVSRAVDVNFAL